MAAAFLVVLVLFVWSITPPPLPAFAAASAAWLPSHAVLLDRHGEELGRIRTDTGSRRGEWVPLARISPAVPAALLAAEDRRFRVHDGVDLRAAAAAIRARAKDGPRRGASTITMQLVGLLAPELAPAGGRGPLAKLRQMRAARVIERRWTKDQILEAYVNLAPSRGELVGIDAASRALFNTAPAGLTAAQSAVFAALLPAPSAQPQPLAARACRIARRTGGDCAATTLAAYAVGSRPPADPVPALAPQLAARLLGPGDRKLRTTLDARVQRLAAAALAQRLADLDPSNARDGAAVVVDNATGEVLAYVASAGPYSRASAVDGAAAPRQAGSTLKPFLYARALDRRLLTAASILDDSPVHLETASGLYVPRDYDESFRGPVSVRSALGNSLNVPAVRALMLTGVDDFRDTLASLGYARLTGDGDYYGFSLALGSAEVTVLEQAAAYRALARGGLYAPLRLTPGPRSPDRRILGPQAAAVAADMLADPAARESTFGPASALALPFWAAVKTGTSKAMRDNWCVGFSTRFTVAVWVGNFEGESMAGVSGVTGAAPAWRAIMLALHPEGAPAPLLPPGVVQAAVRFTPAIEPARTELFVPGTATREVKLAATLPRRGRIVAPADGARIALDPDIPAERQKVAIRVDGAPAAAQLLADGRSLASAFWSPTPGRHRLALADAGGREVDHVTVLVR